MIVCVTCFSFTDGLYANEHTELTRTAQLARGEIAYKNQTESVKSEVNHSKATPKCIISRKQKACACKSSTTGAAYAASGAWRA